MLLSGRRDENDALTHASRRFPVSIKDIYNVCTPELLGQSSLVMPWLTDHVSVDNNLVLEVTSEMNDNIIKVQQCL